MKAYQRSKEQLISNKIMVISSWLQKAFQEFGGATIDEVEAWSYTCSHKPTMLDGCPTLTLEHCEEIAQLAELPLDHLAVALAILRGVNAPDDPTSLGLRRCSGCGQYKNLEDFTSYQLYCKSCKSIHNSYRVR